MSASYLTAWRPDAIIAAHGALVTELGSGCHVTVHDSADVELARIPLNNPVGTVDGTTGVLTITAADVDESAAATGTASYATLRDGSDSAYRSLPCQQGAAAVLGYAVLNFLDITAGDRVALASFTVT